MVDGATEGDLTTMAELAGYAAARYGGQPAQRSKLGGEWAETSYEEMDADARAIALGLIDLGIAPGDRVCILAATNAEWTRAELGAWMAGAVVVPIYPTNSPEECEWVAGNSGAVALFAHDSSQFAKIAASSLPSKTIRCSSSGSCARTAAILASWLESCANRAIAPELPATHSHSSGELVG